MLRDLCRKGWRSGLSERPNERSEKRLLRLLLLLRLRRGCRAVPVPSRSPCRLGNVESPSSLDKLTSPGLPPDTCVRRLVCGKCKLIGERK
jgi:hypothetical protein